MESTEWQEIKDIFLTAIDMPEQKRADYLSGCDGHVRIKVEKLLRADKNAKGFIVESAVVDAGFLGEAELDPFIGGKIDGFKIIREIGHGGMGTVYLARRSDESFDKTVALKLIKRGMDTNAVLKRFFVERSILAHLEHPNIAGLIDGGTTPDGLPYFVMEYVDGMPVTKYCDSRASSINERLELFQKVCAAISYAHANLVVHRDVKPSNILVTQDGTPKLLDFGIAKLLHPDWSLDTAEATATMFRILTPEYASPEQIRGLTVTTASDVYSLGVVLYELLTGERPYKIESRLPDEVAREILTAEPIKPSSVVSGQWPVIGKTTKTDRNSTDENKENDTYGLKQFRNPRSAFRNLKGDLDNIVLKAIRKEPERRYASVQEFSEDIRRHLAGLPVTATADTKIYRLKKFAKRHSAGVAAGCLIVLTLITATVITGWQSIVARRERDRAEQHFNDVRRLTNSFLFEFEESIKDLQGATPAREMTVKKALEYLDILVQEQSNDPSLQFELAVAYSKVADIQGSPGRSNLGDTAGAVASFQKAIEILEKLVRIEPNNREFQKALASNYNSIAYIYANTGDADLTFSNNQSALILYQNLSVSDDTDFIAKLALAECYKVAGDYTASKGDLEEALQNYRKTLAISEALADLMPENRNAKRMIMTASDAIGATLGNPNYTNLGDTDGALQAYQRQLEICQALLKDDEKSQDLQASEGFMLKVIGEVRAARNEWKEAIANYKQSLEIQEKLVKADAKDAFANGRLAYVLTNLGEALAKTNQFADSLKQHNRAIEILENLVETDVENSSLVLSLNRAYQKKGDALVAVGRENDALNFYHKALKSNEAIAAQDLDNMDMRLQLAHDYLQIARANISLANKMSFKKQDVLEEARRRFRQAKEVFVDMQAHNLRTKPIDEILQQISREMGE